MLNSTMRVWTGAVLLCCVSHLCGCASDRIARATEQHIDSRTELLRLLGQPNRITRAEGHNEWCYSSRGFNLFLLRSWNYSVVYAVEENGKVTLDEVNGVSRQYHLLPSGRLPKEFEEFAGESPPEDASLNAHHVAGVGYVMVGDIAHLYSLGHNRSGSRRRAVYRTASAQLTLAADDGEIQINGVPHRLNTPVRSARGELWVTPEDVTHIIDPIFRAAHSRKPLSIRLAEPIDPGLGGHSLGETVVGSSPKATRSSGHTAN